jgi:HAD superfamily phosphatase (TIGR01668 family)
MAFLRPDEYLSSVLMIDAQGLVDKGVTTLLLDIDNTLVPRDSGLLSDEACAWVESLKAAGLRLCLVSNNWHKSVFRHSERLGLPVVYKAMKPAPFAFLRGLRKAQGLRRSAAVVGDQLLTDVLGARLLGMSAILVRPLAKADLRHTLLLRRVESLFMRGMTPTR